MLLSRRARKALWERQERYRTLIEHIGDAVFVTTSKGYFVEVNHAIISSSLTDVLRMSANVLALNIPLGILLDVPVWIITIMVALVISFYILNLSAGFVIRANFPSALDQRALYPLFLMLQVLLLLLPGMIVGGVMGFIFRDVPVALAGVTAVNIIIIGALLLLSNAVFAKLEWK